MHSTRTEPKSGFFYGYVVVLSSFLVLMLVWGAQYSFGIFLKPLLKDFGWTRAVASGAYALNLIMVGVGGVFVGRLSDRLGPRAVVTVCCSLAGLSYLLMSRVSAIWQVYVVYGVLLGVGVSGIWIPLLSTVARWFVSRRGLASGLVASGVGVGTMLMPPVANHLISSLSWRTSYAIIGATVLVLGISVAQLLRRPGPRSHSSTEAEATNSTPDANVEEYTFQGAMPTSRFWVVSTIFFFLGFLLQTVMVHLVPHATDIGMTSAAAAGVVSIIGVISTVSKVGMGSIIDRIGSRRVLIVVSIMAALPFLMLSLSSKFWVLYLFAAVFGPAYGGFAALQSPIVAELFGLKAHGAIFGVAMLAVNIGGAAASVVAGRIFDVYGSYYWAFIICFGFGTLSLILSVLLNLQKARTPNKTPSVLQSR